MKLSCTNTRELILYIFCEKGLVLLLKQNKLSIRKELASKRMIHVHSNQELIHNLT